MTLLDTLVVKIVGEVGDYLEKLDQAKKKTDGFSENAINGLSAIGGGIVIGGIASAAAHAVAFSAALGESINAAQEAESIQAQLEAVLQSTGEAAGVTAQMANNLANNLAGMTAFEDDAIVSGENMLLTFTNIGQDVFPATTQTMLDMSQALGQDLQSSAMQLGKALNDPIKGVTALQRVGVTFTDEQKSMIEAMVKTGDVAGAQKLILAELNKEFGGSAQAAGNTTAGVWTRMQNIWGNVLETLGGALLPTITQLGQQLVTWLGNPATQVMIQQLAVSIAAFAQNVITYLPQVITWFQGAFGWLQQNQGIIAAALAIIGAALIAFALTSLVTAITALSGFMAVAAPVIAIIALIGVAAYLLYEAWKNNWGGIQQVVEAWWTNLQLIWALVQDVFTGNWRKFGEDLRKIWDNTWSALGDRIKAGLDYVKNLFTGWFDQVKGMSWSEIGLAIIQGIQAGFTGAVGALIESWKNSLTAIMDAIKGFLGIHSPSALFNAEVGFQMGAGVLEGWQASIDQMTSLIPATMGGLVPATVGAVGARTAGGMVSGGGGGNPSGRMTAVNVTYENNAMLSVSDEAEMAKRLGPIIASVVGAEIEKRLAKRRL